MRVGAVTLLISPGGRWAILAAGKAVWGDWGTPFGQRGRTVCAKEEPETETSARRIEAMNGLRIMAFIVRCRSEVQVLVANGY